MKLFKFTLASFFSLFVLGMFSTSLSSCSKKTVTVYDTTTVIVKDTITVKDTIIIKDTVIINDTFTNINGGLVAYYNFNGGNLNDSSGYNNNIVFSNATLTADRFGNAGNAYSFDGSTSYMQVKNSASINPNNITLFAIVKPNGFNQATCHGNQIFSKGYPYDVNGFYDLAFFPLDNGIGTCAPTIDTTREVFGGSFGDDYPQGANAGAGDDSLFVQENQWYTLTYTYDGTVARFYVNGSLVNSSTKAITFTPNSNDLFIGKHENPLYQYFLNGVIDEIRIYNVAIPQKNIGYLNVLKTKYLKVGGKLIY